MFRFIGRLILSAILLVLSAAAMVLGKYLGPLLMPFYRPVSQKVVSAISSVTGKLPFALWEILLIALILLFFYSIIHTVVKKKHILSWISGFVLTVSLVLTLFIGLWGLNHFAEPLNETLDLPVRAYSKDELTAAVTYYRDMANRYAPLVERDAEGNLVEQDFAVLAKQAGRSYLPLCGRYPIFNCDTSPVKRASLTWYPLSMTGTTGIFVCLTAESTVNPDTFIAGLPFTMCHEVAHRCCIAGEDEANFAAFLACEASDDPNFLYSGYYSAFIYCYNALFDLDSRAASALWTSESALLRQDCNAAHEHYDPYEGKVQDAAQELNDKYLKAFDEESGVQSYGEAADFLIAWYLQNYA